MKPPERRLHSSNLRSKFLTALDLARNLGWPMFLAKIVPWLFVRRYYICSKSFQDLQPESPPVEVPVRLALATEKDLPAIMGLRPYYYELQALRDRLREGHLCFLGWMGDRLVHIRWIFVKSLHLPYLHRILLLSPGQVLFDEAYTSPEFRARGIFGAAGDFIRLKLRELGYTTGLSALASWQVYSQTLARRIEREKVAEVKIVNWPGFRKIYW